MSTIWRTECQELLVQQARQISRYRVRYLARQINSYRLSDLSRQIAKYKVIYLVRQIARFRLIYKIDSYVLNDISFQIDCEVQGKISSQMLDRCIAKQIAMYRVKYLSRQIARYRVRYLARQLARYRVRYLARQLARNLTLNYTVPHRITIIIEDSRFHLNTLHQTQLCHNIQNSTLYMYNTYMIFNTVHTVQQTVPFTVHCHHLTYQQQKSISSTCNIFYKTLFTNI